MTMRVELSLSQETHKKIPRIDVGFFLWFML